MMAGSPPRLAHSDHEGMDNQVGPLTDEEKKAVRSIFNLYDPEGTNAIPVSEVGSLLRKFGYDPEDVEQLRHEAEKQHGILSIAPVIAEEENDANVPDDYEKDMKATRQDGRIYFDELVDILAKRKRPRLGERTDPKVLEFLRVLEQYRGKCEDEGNYLEAQRASQQLDLLTAQEEKRQKRAIRARQLGERQEVQVAHSVQYTDFTQAWDRYLEGFDNMSQIYVQQMRERHTHALVHFQKQLQQEIAEKPVRWSRELMEWRRRQHVMARQKNYAEAEKIRKIADKMETKEKKSVQHGQSAAYVRREALVKRIEARRRDHVKQKNVDCKRLLQRNRNVQVVLESKQTTETVRLYAEVKKNLETAILGGRYDPETRKQKQQNAEEARRKALGLHGKIRPPEAAEGPMSPTYEELI